MKDYQRVKEFMRKRKHRSGAEDIYAAMEEYAELRLAHWLTSQLNEQVLRIVSIRKERESAALGA